MEPGWYHFKFEDFVTSPPGTFHRVCLFHLILAGGGMRWVVSQVDNSSFPLGYLQMELRSPTRSDFAMDSLGRAIESGQRVFDDSQRTALEVILTSTLSTIQGQGLGTSYWDTWRIMECPQMSMSQHPGARTANGCLFPKKWRQWVLTPTLGSHPLRSHFVYLDDSGWWNLERPRGQCYRVPPCLSGPPGTGKSFTGVEAIRHLLTVPSYLLCGVEPEELRGGRGARSL